MAVDDKIVLNSLASVRRIEDQFTRVLDSTMRKLERQITPLLEQYRVLPAVDAALARQELQNALVSSGYYQVTGDLLNDGYQAVLEEVHDIYLQSVGENFQFAEASLERINALKNLDLGEFGKLGDDFLTTLTRTLTDVNFGAVDYNMAVEILQSNVDKIGNHARTWITTGLSGIYRESSIMLAMDNGIEKFIYVGPRDKITRPFCAKYLNQIKTKAQWDELNDEQGQILPVSQFGGGFNCRHALVGVA